MLTVCVRVHGLTASEINSLVNNRGFVIGEPKTQTSRFRWSFGLYSVYDGRYAGDVVCGPYGFTKDHLEEELELLSLTFRR